MFITARSAQLVYRDELLRVKPMLFIAQFLRLRYTEEVINKTAVANDSRTSITLSTICRTSGAAFEFKSI